MEIGVDELSKTHFACVPKRLVASFLLVLEERSPREADKHHILSHDFAHCGMERTALRPVAFVHKHEEVPALDGESVRILLADDLLQFLKVLVERDLHAAAVARFRFGMDAELVDKRAYQPFGAAVQHLQKVRLRLGLIKGIVRVLEIALDLFVEFGAVCDYQDAWI